MADDSSSEEEVEVDSDDSAATQTSDTWMLAWCVMQRIGSRCARQACYLTSARQVSVLRLRGSGPHGRNGGELQQLSVSYSRASIYAGAPTRDIAAMIDDLLDNRLSASSMRSIHAALAKWNEVVLKFGWPRIIASDDPSRGGKLAAFVLQLVHDTTLVASSIVNYVWALRSWMKLQRQVDPAYGVVEWHDFMEAVAVVAHVPAEPRKAVPLDWIARALATINPAVFWEVQIGHLMLVLLFTFARSETPLPKSFTGEGALDEETHMLVRDFKIVPAQGELATHAGVRLKSTKTDQRMERPEAAGNEDWVKIGDVPDSVFSLLAMTQRLFALHGAARVEDAPFYLDHDRRRPYLYGKALSDMRKLLARVVSKEEAFSVGLHGLRVAGYNAGKRINEELTVAHGGWRSTAHLRYARFNMREVLALTAGIVQQQGGDEEDLPVEAEVPPPMTPVQAPVAEAAERVLSRERNQRRIGRARREAGLPRLLVGPLFEDSEDEVLPVQVEEEDPVHDASRGTPPPVPSDLRPLTGGKADVGRLVLVPHDIWPGYSCDENDGKGWSALVLRCVRGRNTVRFVRARNADGEPFADESLATSALLPL
jgi:hypothetical protein